MNDITTLLARSQGELYQLQGQYSKAEQYYEQALLHCQAAHKAHCNHAIPVYECETCSVDVFAIESNLAKLYDDMGDYVEAALRYEKVLANIEKMPNSQLDTAIIGRRIAVLCNLGLLYHHRWHEHMRAAEYYNQALDVSGVHLGNQSPVTLSIRAHQTQLNLYLASERPIDEEKKTRYQLDTEAMYFNLVLAYKKAVDEATPYASMQLVTWLNNLAVIYHKHQKFDLAFKQYEQALELSMKKGWTSYFSYAVLSTNYAKLIQDDKNKFSFVDPATNYAKRLRRHGDHIGVAYSLYKDIEMIYRDKNGEYYKYYQVADFLSDYAQFFLQAQNYDLAIHFLEKAIEIYRCQKPCLGHDKIVHALEAYSKTYPHTLGHQTPDALYEQLLTEYKQYGTRGYSQLADIQSSYASYLRGMRSFNLAQQYYEEAFTNYNLALHDFIPDAKIEDGWIIPNGLLELVKGRIVQTLVKIERVLRQYWILLRNSRKEKEKQKVGEIYKKALMTFELILAKNHWLLADFYGSYYDCVSIVEDQNVEYMRTKARTIRSWYLASTYQDRKDDMTLAFIW